MPTIAANLPCTSCGYNLHMLDSAGVCPECGDKIEESLREDRLVFEDPRWLRRTGVGMMLVFIYTALGTIEVIAFTSFFMWRGGWIAISVISQWTGFVATIALGLGVILGTSRNGDRLEESTPLVVRMLARLLGVLYLLLILSSHSHYWFDWQATWTVSGAHRFAEFRVACVCGMLAAYVAHVFTLAAMARHERAGSIAGFVGTVLAGLALWAILNLGRGGSSSTLAESIRLWLLASSVVALIWPLCVLQAVFRRAAKSAVPRGSLFAEDSSGNATRASSGADFEPEVGS